MSDADDYDGRVGRNLRAVRQARGLNQEELARRATDRGVPFRQQTIVKIELGQRPLRLREADALSQVLEVDLEAFTDAPLSLDHAVALMHATRGVEDSRGALRAATRDLIRGQTRLQHELEAVRDQNVSVADRLLTEAAAALQVDPVGEVTVVRQAEHNAENAYFGEAEPPLGPWVGEQ